MATRQVQRFYYVDFIDGDGIELFRRACRLALEGIAAKHKHAPYVRERGQMACPYAELRAQ